MSKVEIGKPDVVGVGHGAGGGATDGHTKGFAAKDGPKHVSCDRLAKRALRLDLNRQGSKAQNDSFERKHG